MNPGGRRATSRTTHAGELDALSDIFANEAELDAWYALLDPRVYGYLYARCQTTTEGSIARSDGRPGWCASRWCPMAHSQVTTSA